MQYYCNNESAGCHGDIYDKFVTDYRWNNSYPYIHYPSEYNGEEIMKLCCTQHQIYSDYKRKKITDSWVDLKNVKVFGICLYCTSTSGYIRMEDDSFISNMTSLEYIDMVDVRIDNQVYLTPENVKDITYAAFYKP